MVCAAKGYPLVVTMADSFSIERRKLMRFLGAKVVVTPREQKGFRMYREAVELAEANGLFRSRQLETDANARIVGSGRAQGRSADGSPAESHPAFEPRPIQGWIPDFIPLVLQEAIDKHYHDDLIRSPDRSALSGRESWHGAKAFSRASPAARPLPFPWTSPKRPIPDRSFSACFRIPVDDTCPRPCSKRSKRI
jgi:cysteine synthase